MGMSGSVGARTRTVDLAESVAAVTTILGGISRDIFLFGSRRYKTGSVRSDIDLLVFTDERILRATAAQIMQIEPYLDIFHGDGGHVQSLVNESAIRRASRTELLA